MKLSKALAEYVTYEMGIRGVRESSARTYRTKLNKMFREINIELGNKPDTLPNMDEKQLGGYLAGLRGRQAQNSRRILITAVRTFYRWYCQVYGGDDPSRNVQPVREYIKHPDVLRLDDVERLVMAAGKDHFLMIRNATIVCVLADTGIRVSELCALRVGDVALEGQQFIMTVPAIKGNKSRMIPFCYQQEGNVVAEYFSMYYAYVRFKLGWGPQEYLFQRSQTRYRRVDGGYAEGGRCWWDAGPLSRDAVNNILKGLARRAGVARKVTPHSFRHFYATYLAVKKVSPDVIRQRLGHTSLDRTMIYVHMADVISGDSAKDNPLAHVKAGWKGAVRTLKSVERFGAMVKEKN